MSLLIAYYRDLGAKMRVLVTGGAGFIGSNFVRRTLETRSDVEITVLDALTYAGRLSNLSGLDGKFEFVQGNICDAVLVDSLVAKLVVQGNYKMTMRLLALTRYGSLGSSSRLRMLQYLPALSHAGIEVEVHPLFDDDTLALRYERGRYSVSTLMKSFVNRLITLSHHKRFDLVWIEKEALPWWPVVIEQAMLANTPYVLDFDDAVFHHYDQHRMGAVRWLFGKRVDYLMANAALVICGNEYLAQRALLAKASKVAVLPTVVDLNRYPLFEKKSNPIPRVVWIGSPSTSKYLNVIKNPLRELAMKVPFVLRVIGGLFECKGVDTEHVTWTEETEVEALQTSDIGVMPLYDTSWERGKCGYKLIQYMACSLPVIASPVGVNCSIVNVGHNGYLATAEMQWFDCLQELLSKSKLRDDFGQAGRKQVEDKYCLQITAPTLAQLLYDSAQR
jgi:glycosyltransferase involved in cell wall biosynthesis